MKKIALALLIGMLVLTVQGPQVFAGDNDEKPATTTGGAAAPPAPETLEPAKPGATVTPQSSVDQPSPQGVNPSETGSTPIPGNLPTFELEKITDPVNALESFLLKYVLNPIFLLSAGIAVIMIIYASFQLISGRGQEESITSAKNILTWAIAGLALIMLSYTIVRNLAAIILDQL